MSAGGNAFNLEALRRGLRPYRLCFFPRLRSTNDHATVLRRRGSLFAPAVILTSHQTAGRGRGDNRWFSASGSLTVTFALPIDPQIAPHQLPLIAGLAVRAAAAAAVGSDQILLKWPNDLLFADRKLGGLLCQRIAAADLVGVGLNVNVPASSIPKPLRLRTASLREIKGRPLDMTQLLIDLTSTLRSTLARAASHPFAELLAEYDAHHALVGKRVSVADAAAVPVSGKCRGLDSMGRLLLDSGGVTHRIIAGTVVAR